MSQAHVGLNYCWSLDVSNDVQCRNTRYLYTTIYATPNEFHSDLS